MFYVFFILQTLYFTIWIISLFKILILQSAHNPLRSRTIREVKLYVTAESINTNKRKERAHMYICQRAREEIRDDEKLQKRR